MTNAQLLSVKALKRWSNDGKKCLKNEKLTKNDEKDQGYRN